MLKIKSQIVGDENEEAIYPQISGNEESVADLGYIKMYVRELQKGMPDGTMSQNVISAYLNQIFDLADKVYQRHFRGSA